MYFESTFFAKRVVIEAGEQKKPSERDVPAGIVFLWMIRKAFDKLPAFIYRCEIHR